MVNRRHGTSVCVGVTSPTDAAAARFTPTRAARAFWVGGPGHGELRPVGPRRPAAGEVLVRTLHSGVSRGTETLVFRGRVPADQRAAMRAPHQEGDFPGPVKYGYLSVGRVEEGPADLVGRTVFCLHPHQTEYVVPATAVVPVPDGVPARRAVLAGTVETALNALWDLGPLVGDRIAVVGGGMVGCCVARLVARIPATEVTLVDVAPGRARVAAALGVGFAVPDEAPAARDAVVHCSATAAGLQLSLDLLAAEGTVLDLSWYGDQPVQLSLGGAFHSGRLGIRASQVGAVAAARRATRTHADRLALALELLRDPAFDALLTGESDFEDLPDVMARLADGRLDALCHTIRYPDVEGDPPCTP
ncbi:dehydrogenase [Nocardioides sp. JS614]|nr:dehydrogenase [Nocardioides sp. JS614]